MNLSNLQSSLNNYISVENYNAKIAELENRIAALENKQESSVT